MVVSLAVAESVTQLGVHLVDVVGHSPRADAQKLVGLPDTALREARDQIRAAISNSGEERPQRKITVGLSPASLPKRGSWFDLATPMSCLQR